MTADPLKTTFTPAEPDALQRLTANNRAWVLAHIGFAMSQESKFFKSGSIAHLSRGHTSRPSHCLAEGITSPRLAEN